MLQAPFWLSQFYHLERKESVSQPWRKIRIFQPKMTAIDFENFPFHFWSIFDIGEDDPLDTSWSCLPRVRVL